MLNRSIPKDLSKYYKCNNEIGKQLQKNGFIPKYMDNKFLYFRITKELEIYLNGGENRE